MTEQNPTILDFVGYGIIALGLITNTLSFVIFSRGKTFTNASIGVYYKYLSLFYLLNVIYLTICIVLGAITKSNFQNKLTVVCKVFTYLTSGLSAIPIWLVTMFAVDRAIVFKNYPTQKYAFTKSRKFQHYIVLGICLLNCVVYLPILVLVDIRNNNSTRRLTCSYRDDVPIIGKLVKVFYLIESHVVPFLIIKIASGLILKHRKRLERNNSNDLIFGINSVVVNIAFIVLTAPLTISNLIPMSDGQRQFVLDIVNIFYYANFSVHFFIHICVNAIFRHEFLKLFGLRSSSTNNEQEESQV